jgi:hypothetical protein
MLDLIYDLILQHGKDIFPYLEIRALHSKKGEGHAVKIPTEKYETRTLDQIADIGLIRVSACGDDFLSIEVSEGSIFNEDFRFFCDPPSIQKKVKKRLTSRRVKDGKDSNLDGLVEIVSKAGYPSDWVKSQNKYKHLFRTCVKKYGLDTLKGFAEYLSNFDDKDARSLFTHSFIESYASGSLNKGDPKNSGFINSRQEDEYTQEDF